MKDLVIVESPSKSKTIQKYLGSGFDVVSSRDISVILRSRARTDWALYMEDHFKPTYVISKDKKDVVKDLQTRASKADHVYLATDPDREGEAISWHLAEVLGLNEQDTNRVTFHEITHDAVIDAFHQPRAIDMDLVHSQETRRILDRIIGFKLPSCCIPRFTSKSAGRVQSVALKLIVEREKEIKAFVPQEYWTVDAEFIKDGQKFTASLAKFNGEKADKVPAEVAKKVAKTARAPLRSPASRLRKRGPLLSSRSSHQRFSRKPARSSASVRSGRWQLLSVCMKASISETVRKV